MSDRFESSDSEESEAEGSESEEGSEVSVSEKDDEVENGNEEEKVKELVRTISTCNFLLIIFVLPSGLISYVCPSIFNSKI